jgi:hypothetical protein
MHASSLKADFLSYNKQNQNFFNNTNNTIDGYLFGISQHGSKQNKTNK